MKSFEQKTLFILAIIVFFVLAQKAEAGLEITEIMYDLDGADIDWLEIYNPNSEDEDVISYKLLIGDETKSNHGINSYKESRYLKNGERGIIVVTSQVSSFESKWGNGFKLFTSSFSLSNLKDGGEENISLNKGDKNISLASVSYSKNFGASDNGKSLQIIDGNWEEATPTPGEANRSSGEEGDEEDNNGDETSDSGSSSSTSLSTKKKEVILNPEITTKIITKKTVVAGIPFDISHETIGYKNEKKILGRFVWNFGDGMVREEEYSAPFPYVYEYPGDYALTLSFYDTHFSVVPEATDRVNIKVIPSGVNIISVGPASDPYIEIENNSTYEMTLYKWIIKGNTHLFTIPEGTIILPNKKIKLSPKITGFDASDLSSIFIYDDKGTVFAVYPKQKVYTPARVSSSNYSTNKNVSISMTIDEVSTNNDKEITEKSVIDLNKLEASAGGSDSKIPKSAYPWIGLIVIIILGIVGILSIQKRNKEVKDYMDDEVRPEDMTIME